MAKRPKVYYPKTYITEGLHTSGKELMYKNGKEYVGPYHSYTDGFKMSGALYNEKTSEFLIPYVNILSQSKGNFTYDKIKKIGDISGYKVPKSYYPHPSIDDYTNGYILRYLIKKRNEVNGRIIEVTKKQYETLGTSGEGINGNLYHGLILKWKINGNKDDVIKNSVTLPGIANANKKTLFLKKSIFPGIVEFLGDTEEFSIYRAPITNR